VKHCVARAWSLTGTKFGTIEKYAFSSIVFQALKGYIHLRSSERVIRRYCSTEDFLAIAFAAAAAGITEVDSGGELIDLKDLAGVVKNLVNPSAVIDSPEPALGEDSYYSNGLQWLDLAAKFDLVPETLEDQIARCAGEVLRRVKISNLKLDSGGES
jgi:hypothetical protein